MANGLLGMMGLASAPVAPAPITLTPKQAALEAGFEATPRHPQVRPLDSLSLSKEGALASHQPSYIARAVAPFVKTPLRAGNNQELFVNGADAFTELNKTIDSAKSRLDLEYFAIHNDATGHGVADKLIGKAKEGVQVNVLVDKLANKNNGPVLDKLRAGGVNVREFSNGHDTPLLHPFDIVDHRKVTLVDGRTAISGGMNLGDPYSKTWHDLMTRTEGPSVQDYYSRFEHNWALSGGSPLKKVEMDTTLKGAHAVQIAVTSPKEQEIKKSMIAAFDAAQKYIIVNSPYFIDEDIVAGLEKTAQRGVRVTVSIPTVGDNPMVDLMNNDVSKRLETAGARVYRYDTMNYNTPAHDHGTDHFDHAKWITVDGKWSAVGTANMDTRSVGGKDLVTKLGKLEAPLGANQEIMAFVDSPSFTKELERRVPGYDMKIGRLAKDAVEQTGLMEVAAKALNKIRWAF